jgi:uncharacterized lipoprotein YddW (UPF0748 family)
MPLARTTLFTLAVAVAGVAISAPPTHIVAQPAAPQIPREFRAAWVASVANIDWPSRPGLSTHEQQTELLLVLDRAVELKLNAILLQVRPAADALYDSPHEPWSAYLTGVEGRAPTPYYDPLHFAIAAAHDRGLELHAWVNPYRARHPSAPSAAAANHLSVTHPELVRRYGGYLWMDPGEPAVLAHSLRVMLDLVRRYDLDGIHIDDYFYPYPEIGRDSQPVPFPDSASYTRYRSRGGALERDDWRRHNVDTLVQTLYRRTKRLKPWVKVGISPFGIWRPGYPAQIKGFDAYAKLYADSRKWLREGWVDYFTPQLYWPITQEPQAYAVLARWWAGENVLQRHLWIGHSASRAAGTAWPAGELLHQIDSTRAIGATGDVHFSMRALMPPTVRRDSMLIGVATQPPPPARAAALGEQLRTGPYQHDALVPASPWLANTERAIAPPVVTVRKSAASGDQLLLIRSRPAMWWGIRTLRGAHWTNRVLPASHPSIVLAPRDAPLPTRVVVTAIDRFGRESAAREVTLPRDR